MATLIDSPEFTANEIYEIQQTDPVEGAGAGASFSGIGVSNEPHQQLANRTAFLYGRQNTNIANIGALQSFVANFTGSLKTAGYLRIPLTDVSRGPMIAIIQWGYYALAQQSISNDTTFTVTWPIPFPNAILLPPLATNVYYSTVGGNTAAVGNQLRRCPARRSCSTFQEPCWPWRAWAMSTATGSLGWQSDSDGLISCINRY